MLSALAAAALLASLALAQESEVHLGLGPEAGTAYNGIGLQLHLRVSHFAGYIGAGVLSFWEQGIFQRAEQSSLRVSGGVRWFPGETFFLSLNATKAGFDYHYDSSSSIPRIGPRNLNQRPRSSRIASNSAIVSKSFGRPAARFTRIKVSRSRHRTLCPKISSLTE